MLSLLLVYVGALHLLGQVSIALDCTAMIPKDPSNADDREAAERSQQFQVGWFAHPIFGAGDYPDVMKSYIREASQEHGTSSRLPEFTPKEIEYIKGTGIIFYTFVKCIDVIE